MVFTLLRASDSLDDAEKPRTLRAPRHMLLVLKRAGYDLTVSQGVARSFFPVGTFDLLRSARLG